MEILTDLITCWSGSGGGIYNIKDPEYRRGRDEFGIRLGYRIGQFGGTFNYAYLFTDDVFYEVGNPGPPPTTWPNTEQIYPQIDVFGITLNYAFDFPISLAVTLEATYKPDAPWYDNTVFPGIKVIEKDETSFAVVLQRFTSVFPGQPFMNMKFVYTAMMVEDNDEVKWIPGPNTTFPFFNKNNIVEDITKDTFVLLFDQDFSYKTFKTICNFYWQPDGAYRINPGFKYSPGDHWRYEIYANWWGGSAYEKANKGYLNYFHYQDEIMCRITYQF